MMNLYESRLSKSCITKKVSPNSNEGQFEDLPLSTRSIFFGTPSRASSTVPSSPSPPPVFWFCGHLLVARTELRQGQATQATMEGRSNGFQKLLQLQNAQPSWCRRISHTKTIENWQVGCEVDISLRTCMCAYMYKFVCVCVCACLLHMRFKMFLRFLLFIYTYINVLNI